MVWVEYRWVLRSTKTVMWSIKVATDKETGNVVWFLLRAPHVPSFCDGKDGDDNHDASHDANNPNNIGIQRGQRQPSPVRTSLSPFFLPVRGRCPICPIICTLTRCVGESSQGRLPLSCSLSSEREKLKPGKALGAHFESDLHHCRFFFTTHSHGHLNWKRQKRAAPFQTDSALTVAGRLF